jgi:hypothetical protein
VELLVDGVLLRTTTTSDGNYSFIDVTSKLGVYSVKINVVAPEFVGSISPVVLGVNETVANFCIYMENTTYNITGKIGKSKSKSACNPDGDLMGVKNVVVQVFDSGDNLISTATTGVDGTYVIPAYLGVQTVRVSGASLPHGIGFGSPNSKEFNVSTCTENPSNQGFNVCLEPLVCIKGFVKEEDCEVCNVWCGLNSYV